MEKNSFGKKFKYWFDNRMSKGSVGLLRVFLISTLLILLILAIIGYKIHDAQEQGTLEIVHHLINSWFPSYTDMMDTYKSNYLFYGLLILASIIGILLTSVFIGIITSAIEEKIMQLRKGQSFVLENDHTVVLGFYPGEYELLNQLILAASKRESRIVVVGDMEKDEMEDLIRENLDVPSNVKIICRSLDMCDSVSLEKAALEEAKAIIIAPTDDKKTTKILLAVSKIINSSYNNKVKVAAIMSSDDYRFPPTLSEKHNVTTLQTNDTIAKIIAHSCTQPGISEAFKEIFNFEGNEFYHVSIPNLEGKTFKELMAKIEKAIPVGICRNDMMILNPSDNTVINGDDTIIIFAEDKESFKYNSDNKVMNYSFKDDIEEKVAEDKVLIIGTNKSLKVLLKELPFNIEEAVIVDQNMDENYLQKIRDDIPHLSIRLLKTEFSNEKEIVEIVQDYSHIVVLNRHSKDIEQDDLDNMMLLLKLRDIRTRYKYEYNITTELNSEANQRLVSVDDDLTDYVVATSMSSLFLAQLAESPELYSVFKEILSNEGNEVYLKRAKLLHCDGKKSVTELRQICLALGYIFIGYKKKEDKDISFNPPCDKQVELGHNDSIVVIGHS